MRVRVRARGRVRVRVRGRVRVRACEGSCCSSASMPKETRLILPSTKGTVYARSSCDRLSILSSVGSLRSVRSLAGEMCCAARPSAETGCAEAGSCSR